MAYNNTFKFAPAEWLPFQDGEAVAAALNIDLREKQGKNFENPDFVMPVSSISIPNFCVFIVCFLSVVLASWQHKQYRKAGRKSRDISKKYR